MSCYVSEDTNSATGLGTSPAKDILRRFHYFTYPFARNHAMASANACFGGVWGNPSSRMAFCGLNHILYFAMRTPPIGARGGWPVTAEIISFACATRYANQY